MTQRRASQRDDATAKADRPLMQTTRDVGPQFDGEGDFAFGHSHTWRGGDARTSIDAGHSHRVVLGKIQFNPIDRHTHTLAGEVDEMGDGLFGTGPSGDFVRKSSRRDAEEPGPLSVG